MIKLKLVRNTNISFPVALLAGILYVTNVATFKLGLKAGIIEVSNGKSVV